MTTPLQNRIEKLTMARSGITRADIFTADTLRGFLADRIGGVVCHRINFPKVLAGKVAPKRKAPKIRDVQISRMGATTRATLYRKPQAADKVRPMLSEWEIQDVKQTVAFALIATGALERMAQGGRLSLNDWKVAFRAARGADCLRIDRKAKSGNETLSIDSLTPEETDFLAARERIAELPRVRRAIIVRKTREMHRECFAAFRADTSRNRVSNLRKALAFCAWVRSTYTSQGAHGISEIIETKAADRDAMLAALRMTHHRFSAYLADGQAALTTETLADFSPNLGPVNFYEWQARAPMLASA